MTARFASLRSITFALMALSIIAAAPARGAIVTLLSDNFNNDVDTTLNGDLVDRQGGTLATTTYLQHNFGTATIVSNDRIRVATNSGFNHSKTIVPDVDFASVIPGSGMNSFVVEFDMNPVVGGNGLSGNWAAFSMAWDKSESGFLSSSSSYVNGGGTFTRTEFGILFFDNGNSLYYNNNILSSNIVYDNNPTAGDKTYHVKLEFVTANFGSGTSFSAYVWVDGNPLDLNGANPGENFNGVWDTQGKAYMVLESRTSGGGSAPIVASDFDNLHIYYTTADTNEIPEPSTWALAICAIGFGGFVARRRRNRVA